MFSRTTAVIGEKSVCRDMGKKKKKRNELISKSFRLFQKSQLKYPDYSRKS